jgi:hypothetical protein
MGPYGMNAGSRRALPTVPTRFVQPLAQRHYARYPFNVIDIVSRACRKASIILHMPLVLLCAHRSQLQVGIGSPERRRLWRIGRGGWHRRSPLPDLLLSWPDRDAAGWGWWRRRSPRASLSVDDHCVRRRASAAPRVASRPPAWAPSLRPAVGAVVRPTSSRLSERRTPRLAAPRGWSGAALHICGYRPSFGRRLGSPYRIWPLGRL